MSSLALCPVRWRFPCGREQPRLGGVPGAQHLCNSDEQTGQPRRRRISLGEGGRRAARGSLRRPPVALRGAPGGVPLPSDSDRSSVFPEGLLKRVAFDSTAKTDRIPAEARGLAVTTRPCQAGSLGKPSFLLILSAQTKSRASSRGEENPN